MGTCRYGISLRVSNLIAHECDVELSTRREIPYLQATMYYFVYHKEKPTSLTNEYK